MRTTLAARVSLLVLAAGVCLLASRRSGAQQSEVKSDPDAEALRLIANYKVWLKANAKPQLVVSHLAALCTTPTPEMIRVEDHNPHMNKYINVFVNPDGAEPFLSRQTPHFLEGTVIVKEKLSTETSVEPELLTVMVKREAGFNPKYGDWEFFTFNGAATKVTARGKIESCQECHVMRQDQDYVFRGCLSDEVRKQLK
jgi:hypothetical protein